jgi:hypothetical protein
MSSKRDADDDDNDYDGDFRGEADDDDDDEDDEDEFIPGAEEAEDDEDHDGLDLMRGKCSLDNDKRLVLQGDGFSLCSTEAFDASCKGSSLLLVGHWQLAGDDPKRKAPPRRINLSVAAASSSMTNTPGKRSETERDSTEEREEMIVFDIQGTEETTGDETIQVFGRVVIGTAAAPHDFTCRMRRITTRTTTTTTAAGSTPQQPAAAASAKKSRHDDDDDDAEGEDADDDVDFDELAALHEEARMPVDAVLNKRYRAGEADQGDGGSASKKRGKTESDDEEDIEF